MTYAYILTTMTDIGLCRPPASKVLCEKLILTFIRDPSLSQQSQDLRIENMIVCENKKKTHMPIFPGWRRSELR